MSKTFRNAGILLASTCGVLTSYAALRPALEEQKAEREGRTLPLPDRKETMRQQTMLSDQMRDDFRDAGKELERGGFAWGIREALFGKKEDKGKSREGDGRG